MTAEAAMNHLKSLIEKGRVVPVIGTGFSVWTSGNAPTATWKGLLNSATNFARAKLSNFDETIANSIEKELSTGTANGMTLAAGAVEMMLGGAESETFKTWLQESVGLLPVRRSE